MANLVAFGTYFILFSICHIEAKIRFPKDQKMDIPFPPKMIKSYSTQIPDGHLRPLGWQRTSSGQVTATPEQVTAHALHLKYLKNNKPILMPDVIKGVPVLEKWKDDSYLNKKYGKLNVKITVKKQMAKEKTQYEVMMLKDFLSEYMHEDWYLSSTIPKEMMEEIPLPEFLKCGTYKSRLQEAEVWMSSGGTASLLHSHEDHNAHCVLFGRKDFIIIEKQYRKNFAFQEKYLNAGAGYSALDMDMINVFKYPDISRTPWTYATLKQGDCIVVPAGYLHQVRSYGRGISFTILFSPTREFDSSDCRGRKEEKNKKNQATSLSDVKFVWIYKDGQKKFSEESMEPSVLKNILWLLIRDNDRLYYEQFEHFYNQSLSMSEKHPPAREVFDILAPSKKKEFLSRDYLKNINPHKLLHVSRIYKEAYARKSDDEAEHDEL